MLHFWVFLQYHQWQTPDHWCVVERHLCITRRRSLQWDAYVAYRPSVNSTLLLDIRRQRRFLLRYAGLCRRKMSVCPSVCPSVCHTPVLSINGYTYPQSFFTVGSPTILVFPYQTGWQYSDGTPPRPNGDEECKGVWKNHNFRPISRFFS